MGRERRKAAARVRPPCPPIMGGSRWLLRPGTRCKDVLRDWQTPEPPIILILTHIFSAHNCHNGQQKGVKAVRLAVLATRTRPGVPKPAIRASRKAHRPSRPEV